jgi:CubicO group peptidase (beta-lactamase class C family)
MTIQEIISSHNVPSAGVAVIKNCEIQSIEICGVKNALTKERTSIDTIYEASSLSKTVFGYAVLNAIEKGLIGIDDSLSDFFDSKYIKNDPRVDLISIRQVLTHTPGLPNWRPKHQDLQFILDPGSKFSYSGEGFLYLQRAIENFTGRPIDSFMKEEVYDQLRMLSSSYEWSQHYEKTKASGHDKNGEPFPAREKYDANVAYTLHTTILDYAKFIATLSSNNQILDLIKETQVPVYNKYTGDLIENIYWGLGWGLQNLNNYDRFIWHWGDTKGFKSYIAQVEESKYIVIFTNGDNGLRAISDILSYYGEPLHPALVEIVNL